MADSFSKVLVKDDRIGNLTDSLTYGVFKGGQSIVASKFMATSSSTTSHVYNIIVPSETTIIDRLVIWESTVVLRVSGGTNNTGGAQASIVYGGGSALAPFPLHQLVSIMSCTINNNTVSMNTGDLLAPLLNMIDPRDLGKYSSFTPTMIDRVGVYSADGSGLNPLSSFANAGDYNNLPRGAFSVELASNANFAAAMVADANTANRSDAYIRFTVREPLLLSPFIFNQPKTNNSGIYGITNMNFTMNMRSNANRAFRTMYPGQTVSIESFENSSLNFTFLTPHPSDLLSARCVVPYMEFGRYIYSYADPAGWAVTPAGFGTKRPTPGAQKITFNSISLNQIPDKVLIFARKPIQAQTPNDPDCYFPITNISINFNNTAGLCSSMSQFQLWQASVQSGSQQSWHEFVGYINRSAGNDLFSRTTGSILALSFGKHIPLTEDYLSCGSIGNYVLQFTVDIQNYGLATGSVELCCMVINSGAFICERGSSTVYTSLLSKQDVLETSQQEYHTQSDLKRMVGGGFLDTLRSTVGKAKNIYNTVKQYTPLVKQGLRMTGNQTAKNIADGMEAVGLGYSGGSSNLLKRLK